MDVSTALPCTLGSPSAHLARLCCRFVGWSPRAGPREERAMPKLTLVQDRRTVQIYDLDQPVIRIGRVPGMDIQIDDVSISRRQAEIQQEGDHWVVRDIGSSNGTFVNGERLAGDRPLKAG